MKNYKHILCPIDFSKTSKKTLEKAISLKDETGATITVIHFVEPMPPTAYAMGVIDAETGMVLQAKEMMNDLAKEYSLTDDQVVVESGRAKHAIAEYAQDSNVDLIIIGRHGHHGILSGLAGSTASATVSHAHCDVFVVGAD